MGSGARKRTTGGFALLALAVGGLCTSPAAASDKAPSAPRSVDASAAPAAVEVTWEPPSSDGGAKIDKYKVVTSATDLPKLVATVSGRKRSAKIKGLAPGTTYSSRVLAHNARGWGKASKKAEAAPLAAAGFGTITGTCGVVEPQLDEPTPSLFENRFDFEDDWFDPGDRSKLTEGGQQIFDDPNLGGSSIESEIMAFELLHRCEGATLLKTETEILYDQSGFITDLLVEIADSKVGVSVTRLYKPGGLSQTEVSTIIEGKLEGIQGSSQNVSDEDAWVKQVLVVMAYDDAHADKAETAWLAFDAELKSDTVLYLVTTDGSDGSIYCNPDGPTCP